MFEHIEYVSFFWKFKILLINFENYLKTNVLEKDEIYKTPASRFKFIY